MIADLKPYPAMKDSGVEWLGEGPAHWESKKLRTILRNVTVRNRPDLQLLSVVREKGVIVRDVSNQNANHNFIPDDLTNYKMVREGQFTMNKMKAWQGSYGVSRHDGIVSPAYFVFDLNDVTGDFFNTAIRSKAYVPFFTQASDGVRIGQWDLSQARTREITFSVPPLPEQAAIVRYLDYVDRRLRRLLRAKRKLIALLTEQKQVIIHRVVTRGLDPDVPLKDSDVEWLGKVPEHWEVAALRLMYHQCLGKMLDAKRIAETDLLPYLRNTDVQWGRINFSNLPKMDIPESEYERYTVRPEDLLVCEGGELGRAAIWLGEIEVCGFQKALHRLRPRDADRQHPRFMYFVLRAACNSSAFSDGHVSTIAHLTGDKLRAHRLAFPPFQEQLAIVRHLDKCSTEIDTAITRANREIDLLIEYRTRLFADVVTGKLDVRKAAAALPEVDPLAANGEPDDALEIDAEADPDELDAIPEKDVA